MEPLISEISQRQQFLDLICSSWISDYHRKGGIIFCNKGCSGCCTLVVNCTFPEAVQIARALSAKQQELLRERIPRLREIAGQSASLKEWLAGYRQLIDGCPFLDTEGACGIYGLRPLSCRSLLATREPHWCSTDFSSLSHGDKQSFMAQLDRTAVAFPTHYAATPQEMGQELEQITLTKMETVYGCSLLGNLPWLVWLEQEYAISTLLPDGPAAVRKFLETRYLLHPFLAVLLEPHS